MGRHEKMPSSENNADPDERQHLEADAAVVEAVSAILAVV
jgi:hypothetical protein